MKTRALLLLALPLLCACASGGAGPSSTSPGSGTSSRPRTSSSAITREEIVESHLSDVYSVVQRLRPRWLRRRGPDVPGAAQDVVVYVDSSPRGYSQALRGIPTSSTFQVRFVDSITAKIQYGPGHEQGVIVVVTDHVT